MPEVDWEKVKDVLVGMTLADHIGDINEDLPRLCVALGLPKPFWCEGYEQNFMLWGNFSDYDDEEELEQYNCGEEKCPVHGRIQ